ncbi:hypothetical protein GA0115257_114317 [Streptomyces sp. LcepLS]|nr:hypothetical protein GA0115257_114317 [Streptomyces sp. LcepLS]
MPRGRCPRAGRGRGGGWTVGAGLSAGAGAAGWGSAGSGLAGSGLGGSRLAGSGSARPGLAGSGSRGSGAAGAGAAGAGSAGSGLAGVGLAGHGRVRVPVGPGGFAARAGGVRGPVVSGAGCGVGGRREFRAGAAGPLPYGAVRDVVHVRAGAEAARREAHAAALHVPLRLQLPQCARDQDLALREVRAQRGDRDAGAVRQREDVGGHAHRDRAAPPLGEGVRQDREVGRQPGADVDHSGGRRSVGRRAGIGACARVRLPVIHREGASS